MEISRRYVIRYPTGTPPRALTPQSQENTLIDDAGNAQLCDFGLARILDAEPTGLTTSKTASWSLRYASPEIIKSDQLLHTLQSDVWAWGCLVLVVRVYYYRTINLLTLLRSQLMMDTLPYSSQSNERAIENSIRSGESPADISTTPLPDLVRSILELCWRQDPTDRIEMFWCLAALTVQPPSLFALFADVPLDEVPSRYKAQGDGWNILRNPASTVQYEYEFVEDIVRNVELVI